ncbi:MAG: preprotein translocase subunit SecG [Wenzhouxiangellaceae bacterium]|nr:preprotein translocase subunit SecG [Wenzhouxiangellaceae bacterium]
MFTILIVFQVLLAFSLIAIVLVQRGTGATMGAAFGAGASGTVFGSRGAGNFLTRTTTWLAVGFMGISLAMAVLAAGSGVQGSGDASLTDSVVEQPAGENQSPALDAVIESLDQPEQAADDVAQPAEAAQAPASEDEAAQAPVSEDDGAAAESAEADPDDGAEGPSSR